MNAKRPPSKADENLDHLQTRKIDSMSSLAADLFLREQDGNESQQRAAARNSSPPPPQVERLSQPLLPSLAPRRASRTPAIVAGAVALVVFFALAAFLLTR